jgi:hypothetical protein
MTQKKEENRPPKASISLGDGPRLPIEMTQKKEENGPPKASILRFSPQKTAI